MSGARAVLRGIILLLAAAALAMATDAPLRIGDAGSVADPARFDPRYPDMAEWAKAGVRGGIPPRAAGRVVALLKPGDDLQAAIDRAGQGVVLLAAGTYDLDAATRFTATGTGNQPCGFMLRLREGVILRGEDRDRVVLRFRMPEPAQLPTGRFDGFDAASAIEMASRSGLEDLTVVNAKTAEQDYELVRGFYKNPGIGDTPTSLRVPIPVYGKGVSFQNVSDAWMQRCRIIDSGTNPVSIGGCTHVTCRDNVVERSWNKGGSGNGYYHITGGSHNLLYAETIADLRHLCLMSTRHNVIYGCDIAVDVNYHGGPMTSMLVEACTLQVHPYHVWGRDTHGFSRSRGDPGPGNLVFRVAPACLEGVWAIANPPAIAAGKPHCHRRDDLPPPAGGTFYAVTGQHLPYERSADAVRQTPPTARRAGGPAEPAAAPKRASAGPDQATRAVWDERLIASLRAAADAGVRPSFDHPLAPQPVAVTAVDGRGVLALAGEGLALRLPFATLEPDQRADLALALVDRDAPPACALAAYHCLAAGRAREAAGLLPLAGDEAAAIRALFAR